MKKIKKNLIIIYLFILGLSLGLLTNLTYAEQSGSSPNTGGVSSVMSKGYDFLVSKGTNYGNSQPSDWINNWGTMWNRIMYSAAWEPDGTAVESVVTSTKSFYSGHNNRTTRLGSFSDIDYFLQQYVATSDSWPNDYIGEESVWINTNTTPAQEVWFDTRVGLYWARSEPAKLTNNFSAISGGSCPFYTTVPRGDYGNSGTDPDCGDAINACATLSLASISGQNDDTDWYLPSIKELFQSYIDGIYNQTNSNFVTKERFWSSTEYSGNNTTGWGFVFHSGYSNYNGMSKTSLYPVKCVRRD